ncbi:MAG: hypothetical protein WBA59_01760 [Moheibacter sp.]
MSFLRKHLFAIPVFNFLIAAWFGLTLRSMMVHSMPFNFKFLTHAHSHVAILGWVYMALFLLLAQHFVGKFGKGFQRLFLVTQIAVLGMIIGFPTQGYGLISIVASSLYIIFSYVFTRLMLKKTKGKSSAAYSLMRTSLVWLCLSTVSLWALGPIIATQGATSKPALLTIQYFLHFQLNGWFLFAIVALFFHFLKLPASKTFDKFHLAFVLSLVYTFGLPINWYYDFSIFRWMNAIGVIFQLMALYWGFILILDHYRKFFLKLDRLSKFLLQFAAVSFLLKIGFQTFSLIPDIAKHIFDNRQAVIGFIHLMMLGIISAFLFFAIRLQIKNKITKRLMSIGICFFLAGILLTEAILLYQGFSYYFPSISISNYKFWLWIFSFALVAGIYMILVAALNFKFKDKPEEIGN